MGITYISVICENKTKANTNMNALLRKYNSIISAEVSGNEIIILVPPTAELGFSLRQLKDTLVSPVKVDLFNLERNEDGDLCRYWYFMPA